ncbi:membrane protein [Corynebacterium phocae]|uniref:Membrane protein n=1 Tax=Corynebacterium phocae TaxID=161895 RepID=A0A1L7D5G6_9CORY|nr:alpha-(1->3)-arabinofuranosyltransferase family protein [Corynebacterium phocae]APT93378.1 membrane protein [Corynebacterium phocae]KAA8721720.1 DUF3367 domain-containing protein [Corynebacterium phocae]
MRGTFRWHALGWLCLAVLVFLQPFGLIAADTKLDLTVDPLGFLAGALTPYSDNFPLGQLQNQAYGYIFPHGLFFVLTDALPDWIAQRLWWTLVLGTGFSGMLALARRVGLNSWQAAVAAVAFALSPRTLTTLTAISSEAWPVMLAPWVIYPFLGRRVDSRAVAAAVLPVACMGAVNATATLAACLPAAVVVVYRRQFRALALWLAGCAAVSLWWIGPLLILGHYAPPFTDYIESAYVTTRWLNLPEILRGTTSWSPFVDTERQAGHLLAASPVFVLATALLAAVSLAGLTRAPRVWKNMLLIGLGIMACHFPWYLEFLDGPGAFMRNLHKFEPLVRLPLALGLGFAAQALRGSALRGSALRGSARRNSALALIVTLLAVQSAPAWSGRLLPQGAYQEIPAYWYQAAEYINRHAAHTRTLIYPPRMFAREEWGWTRDEPAQALLDTPWAVRDAIPLVPPEAIRGLDGVMAAVEQGRLDSLKRLGIGAVISRTELADARPFGPLYVQVIDPHRDVLLTADAPVRVAGGGESLAFIPGPAQLVTEDAQVVTDTPLLIDRNFGSMPGSSAPLVEGAAPKTFNRERDYPSAGRRVSVRETGGAVRASSSWADATAIEPDPAKSVTAAVDGRQETAWWPAPGDLGWLEFAGNYPARVQLRITATADIPVIVRNGHDVGAAVRVNLLEDEEQVVTVPGGATDTIRVELLARAGINAQVIGHEVRRVVSVPDHSPGVQEFFFQRLLVDTGVLIREFTAPRQMTVTLDSNRWVTIDGKDYFPGQELVLDAGPHVLETRGRWVRLNTGELNYGRYQAAGREITASETQRLLVTGRAYNPGLRGFLGDLELEPREVDAATQAFVVPAGAAGHFSLRFVATPLYRLALGGGGALALMTVLGCAWFRRTDRQDWKESTRRGVPVWLLALAGWPAAAGWAVGWAVVRWTRLPQAHLVAGLMVAAGAMLARGAWGSGAYAGDFWLTAAFSAAAVAVAVLEPPQNNS